MRIYGTRCPKAAFDIFARCTISAWAAATHPDDTSIKIREYALLRWRKVPWEQKSVWQKLHEDRHDPAVDVDHTGRRLLLSQDLLKVMVPENRFPAAKIHCQQPQSKQRATEARNGQLPERSAPVKKALLQRSHPSPVTGGDLPVSEQSARGEPYASMYRPSREHPRNLHILTSMAEISESFPRLSHAMSNTCSETPCFVPTIARRIEPLACMFVLNTPDMCIKTDLTEAEIRAACQQAKLPGMTEVTRQNHNVFVVSFANRDDAKSARRKARLSFAVAPDTSAQHLRFSVGAEFHWPKNNYVYFCDIKRRFPNHESVSRHVFEALEGPVASSLRLHKLNITNKKGRVTRIRYILRPLETLSPICVERFYIPLAANEEGHIWGIFKPWSKHWECPGCHKKCQAGDVNACEFATELPRVTSDER